MQPKIHYIRTVFTDEQIELAVDILKVDGVIISPTDTLYGILALAESDNAVQRIFDIKKRSSLNALPLMAESIEQVQKFCDISGNETELAEHFWPGSLTIVLPLKKEWSHIHSADDGTVAVRVPYNEFCREIARKSDSFLTATSTNFSGEKPAELIENINLEIISRVNLVFDAGICNQTKPSTIVRANGNQLSILREGAIDADKIMQIWKEII